ncbi:Hypothetical protein CINCED_3A022880 [Cinara cedri]|uniref:Uncharacterized protein n=1 Tax=Cinara cedri TaxID=506608 RepID=A0A5E4MIZ2_9HEMI|nr:Hypothetical protein CINCED_3A022880 [Cinara cedri]
MSYTTRDNQTTVEVSPDTGDLRFERPPVSNTARFARVRRNGKTFLMFPPVNYGNYQGIGENQRLGYQNRFIETKYIELQAKLDVMKTKICLALNYKADDYRDAMHLMDVCVALYARDSDNRQNNSFWTIAFNISPTVSKSPSGNLKEKCSRMSTAERITNAQRAESIGIIENLSQKCKELEFKNAEYDGILRPSDTIDKTLR